MVMLLTAAIAAATIAVVRAHRADRDLRARVRANLARCAQLDRAAG